LRRITPFLTTISRSTFVAKAYHPLGPRPVVPRAVEEDDLPAAGNCAK
jgi:hypothetical protein